jgi:hypothetical protein
MRLNLVEREWNWINDGLLPYALAAMRAVWVWLLLHLWARAMIPPRAELVPPLVVFALLVVSTLLAQYGAFRAKNSALPTVLLACGGLLAVGLTIYLAVGSGVAPIWDARWLTALRADAATFVGVLFAAVWLWRWGILAGREPLIYDEYARNFGIGVFVFALAFYFAFTTQVVALSEMVLPLLFFFAVGLGVLAIASLQQSRQYERERTGESFALNRYWLGTVGGVVAALVLTGLVVGQLFAPDTARSITNALAFAYDVLVRVLLLIAFVFAFVFFNVVGFFGQFVHIQSQPQTPPTPPPFSLADQFKDWQQPPSAVSPELYLLFQIAAGLLIALVVVLIFARAFRRFRVLREEDVEETRESVLSLDLLKEQLSKLFGRKRQAAASGVPPFVVIKDEDASARVRRIYQNLLAWAAARGVARSPGQTPLEYLLVMERALHLYSDPIATITSAYLQARYSSTPLAASRADAAARAWEQLARADGKGVIGAQRG